MKVIGALMLAALAAGQEAKPRAYRWWFGDTVTTNGITHDLEAMKRMGRVWRGVDAAAVYAAIGLRPDFAATEGGRPVDPKEVVYTHRVDGATDIYFIANVTDKPKRLTVTFRGGETREIALGGSSSTFVEFGMQ